MKISVPKESYPLERRVMVLPSTARSLINAGHEVFVQETAAEGIGISDKEYRLAGAEIISCSSELFEIADMVIKLKMPSPGEYALMRNLIMFGMVHSEQNPYNIYFAGLNNLQVVEMEKVRDEKGERLINQTGITGEAGVYYAIQHFQKLPSEMKVVILGYGGISSGAIKACSKLGIDFKIIIKAEFPFIAEYLNKADLLINGLCWPAEKRLNREYLVSREDIRNSKPGMIILDLAVDDPSPIETLHPTSYSDPFYLDEGRVHISIYGYPGLFPKSSSEIYSRQVLPLALTIANNNGLDSIGDVCDLGKAIEEAVLNPDKYDWRQFKKDAEMHGKGISA